MCRAPRQQRRGGGVEDHQVGVHARRQAADAIVERERPGVAQCQSEEPLPGGQRLAAQLAHLVGGLERGEPREVGAAAHVAGVGDVEGHLPGGLAVEEPAAQEEVGAGAEGEVGAALGEPPAHLLVEVDAVGEGAARAHQAGPLVDLQVVAAAREELGHPVELAGVLGEVGLQPEAFVVAQQRSGGVELLAGGGGGEARGQAVAEAPLAVPVADQPLAVADAAHDVVGEPRRRVAVHQHLAGQHAEAAAVAGREEGVHRGRVTGAEHLGGGGADPQQLVEEGLGERRRMVGVGEAQLLGEGVVVQPVEQLAPVGGDDLQLHVVDMAVDKAGHYQFSPMIDDLDAGGQVGGQGGVVVNGTESAVLDPHRAIGVVAYAARRRGVVVAGVGIEAQQFGAQHARVCRRHGVELIIWYHRG